MFNGAIMIIACPACATRYVVPDSAIGVEGRTVRCAKCRHSWFQDGPELLLQTPVAAQPTPVPQPAATEPAGAEVAPEAEPPVPAAVAEPPAPASAPPPPPPPLAEDDTYRAPRIRDDAPEDDEFDSGYSSFAHEPPFRARRNPARMWTIAAGVFAIVALGAVGATAWYGLPDWVPFSQGTFAEAQTGLVLDFPAKRQEKRELPDKTNYFSVNGTISNVGREKRSVPSLLVVLRDQRERIVYSREIAPSQRVLAPGESLDVNEALTDVPKSATLVDIGWKPG